MNENRGITIIENRSSFSILHGDQKKEITHLELEKMTNEIGKVHTKDIAANANCKKTTIRAFLDLT